jgi:hypothetical protein
MRHPRRSAITASAHDTPLFEPSTTTAASGPKTTPVLARAAARPAQFPLPANARLQAAREQARRSASNRKSSSPNRTENLLRFGRAATALATRLLAPGYPMAMRKTLPSVSVLSTSDDATMPTSRCRKSTERQCSSRHEWRERRAALPLWRSGGSSVQSSRPALTCIIGARRAWIVPMISSTSIPCR